MTTVCPWLLAGMLPFVAITNEPPGGRMVASPSGRDRIPEKASKIAPAMVDFPEAVGPEKTMQVLAALAPFVSTCLRALSSASTIDGWIRC